MPEPVEKAEHEVPRVCNRALVADERIADFPVQLYFVAHPCRCGPGMARHGRFFCMIRVCCVALKRKAHPQVFIIVQHIITRAVLQLSYDVVARTVAEKHHYLAIVEHADCRQRMRNVAHAALVMPPRRCDLQTAGSSVNDASVEVLSRSADCAANRACRPYRHPCAA